MSAPLVGPRAGLREVVLAHVAFRAALDGLTRPGRPIHAGRQEAALGGPETFARVLALALFDPDTPVAVAAGDRPEWLPEAVPTPDAGWLFVPGGDSGGELERLPRGTPEAPESGGCAVYVLERAHHTPTVLTGPGVAPGDEHVALPWPATELVARHRVCQTWPLGVDLLAVLPDGVLVGLPRTTRVIVHGAR